MELFKGSFKLIQKPRLAPPPSRIGMISIGIICLLGFGAAALVGYSTSETYKQNHLQRTSSIAEALPQDELIDLKGEKEDLDKPTYTVLKDRLERIRQSNSDVRIVSITTYKQNNVHYIANSEDEGSPNYSQPGKIYNEASVQFRNAFVKQRPFFEGPYSDRGETWVSSASPIFNADNGLFIGMLSIDSPPSQYYYDVASRMIIPILIALTASLLLWKIDNVRRKHEEISQLKSQFVSIASHELRSPLSGMLWAIQSLLKDKDINKQQHDLLNDMFKSTQSSLTTVNEILDMSVFERAKVSKIQKVDMDLNIAMREVIKNLKLGASEKNIQLKVKHLDVSAPLIGDPGAVKRALMNVVANAIKYSPENSKVAINYQRVHGTHILKIVDRGIGIPKRDIKKVLSGYYRSKNAVKMQSTGTGLGLYVTKLIVEQHRGTLELLSKEGDGTVVIIRLPAHIKD